jgi:hypothetical protein
MIERDDDSKESHHALASSIQYAAAFGSITVSSGILDHPLFAGDDSKAYSTPASCGVN